MMFPHSNTHLYTHFDIIFEKKELEDIISCIENTIIMLENEEESIVDEIIIDDEINRLRNMKNKLKSFMEVKQ